MDNLKCENLKSIEEFGKMEYDWDGYGILKTYREKGELR